MKVYLISEKTLKADSLVNNNIDGMYINPAIQVAQDMFLQPLLGSVLYKRICDDVAEGTLDADYKLLLDDYITPFLEFRVMADIQIPLNYKLRNAGVVQNSDVNIQTVSLDELKYLTDFYENKATFYANRLSDFLCHNSNIYKEYLMGCSCAGMKADRRCNTIINLH